MTAGLRLGFCVALLSGLGCGTRTAPNATASMPRAHAHLGAKPLSVSAGALTAGGDDVTCSLRRAPDRSVKLVVTLKAECATSAPLALTVQTDEQRIARNWDVRLAPSSVQDLDVKLSKMPARTSVVHVEASAWCTGARREESWGRAQCKAD